MAAKVAYPPVEMELVRVFTAPLSSKYYDKLTEYDYAQVACDEAFDALCEAIDNEDVEGQLMAINAMEAAAKAADKATDEAYKLEPIVKARVAIAKIDAANEAQRQASVDAFNVQLKAQEEFDAANEAWMNATVKAGPFALREKAFQALMKAREAHMATAGPTWF